MLVFSQMDPTNFFPRKIRPKGAPDIQNGNNKNPGRKKIPIPAMAALKISRKHRPWQHQPYDFPTWGQIKTLTNEAENLVSQQGIPQSPEYIFLLACVSQT